jgi:hypothetical protein
MKYEFVDLANLNLDPKNPRLPTRLQSGSQEDVINWMLTDASLIELMLAIGSNGFFPGEPLLVVEENGKLVVVEGNRRLASLLLLNEIVAPSVQVGSVGQVINLTKERPDIIPVIKFDFRAEIEKYLGFRHVTGVKEWSPLAKARYLKSILNSVADGEVTQEQYLELAKQIGSKRPYVQRLIVSYDLYELIEREEFYNIASLNEDNFHFTYLMDSLNRPEIRNYIGVNFDVPVVLGELKADKFQQLIELFFLKRSNGKPAMNASSGQLAKFCDVLLNSESLVHFLKEGDLDSAFDLTIDKEIGYRDSVSTAEENLKNALVSITDVSEFFPSDQDKLKDIIKYAKSLLKQASND